MSRREHLTFAAERGSKSAISALEGPECPMSLRYLYEWCTALHGRSGVGMSGFAPLSWGSLGEWSRFTGNVPDEEDINALFILDAVMSSPGDPKDVE